MFKSVQSKAAAIGTAVTLMVGNAMAAVDPAVATAISDGTADGKTIAYGILTLSIVLGVIALVRRKA